MGISTKRAGDFKLPFGKYAGWTLDDILEDNPGYLDWLGSQTWLYGPTKKAVHEYLEIGYVQEAIQRKFWNATEIDGGDLHYEPTRKFRRWDGFFIPSQQTSRLFSHGKPQWLKVKWGRRPKPDLEDNFKPGDEWMTPAEAWELAADILRICDEHFGDKDTDTTDEEYVRKHFFPEGNAEDWPEDCEPPANWEKRHQLKKLISSEAYELIRKAFREMRIRDIEKQIASVQSV
jgi:uncharacterized protein (DUF3820 family)